DNLLAALLAFKTLALAFFALDLALIWAILGRWRPGDRRLGVYLVAWNPLVVLDVAGNGHNDIVMAFFVLLALYALARGWDGLVLPALTLGALIKFTPAILLPLATVYLLARAGRQTARRGPRFELLLGSMAISAALAALLYLPFWQGPSAIGFLRRGDLFTASLGN